MKRFKSILVVLVAAVMLAGCTLTLPVAATSNSSGSKVGESTATVILGFPIDSDASIQTAIENGGISEIYTVDITSVSYLNLFVTYTTTVTGE